MVDHKDLDSLSLDDLEYTVLVDHPSRILVVDDEDVIRMVFDALLSNTSYDVGYAESAEQALEKLQQDEYSLLIVDKNLPGQSGLELVRRVRKEKPDSAFIMITGYASYDSAVEALRLGAFDYLEKPFSDLMLVKEKISQALERQRLLRENYVLADHLRSAHKDLRSKAAAIELTNSLNRLDAVRKLQDLRDRVNRAYTSLHSAYRKFQALSDNRIIPEQPAKEIGDLLEESWAELSTAMIDQDDHTTH